MAKARMKNGCIGEIDAAIDPLLAKISISKHKDVYKRQVYGKQQSFYFFIGLHRFPALAVQPALTRVPQPGGAGELARCV